MIAFLFKGLLRDRSRSLFPFLTVVAGVVLTVLLHTLLGGVVSSVAESTAHFSTGHVCVMTRAYAREADQVPNDLALLGIDTLLGELRREHPDLLWSPRIKFGGILDIPDEHHETRAQAPVGGIAVDLLGPGSPELRFLDIRRAIVRGRVPQSPGEILIGDELASVLHIQPGDTATLIGSTMYGSMSVTNFQVAGTVRFGVAAMDKGTMIADVRDMQRAMDMEGGAGEILGFFPDDIYHEERADAIAAAFNARHAQDTTGVHAREASFSPVMGTLRSVSGLGDYIDLVGLYARLIIGIFVVAMSIVLWNAGLTGSLRRYGEIGVRLAVGEDKNHVYYTLLGESLIIGLIGSFFGTAIGLVIGYALQVHGLDIGAFMKESTLMIPNVVRTQITPSTSVIGFLPGLLATLLGTAISGIGIYRRQTSQLFKELE